eukprot:gene10420-13996_t
MLSKRLSVKEWFTIVSLAAGVGLVESSQNEIIHNHASNFIGVISVFTAIITSGLAGVYFEKIMKASKSSIWMINIELSLLSIFFSVFLCLMQDVEEISRFGILKGYNSYVILIIVVQAITGL